MSNLKLAILSSGMISAVGFNTPACCAAMRAGISGIKQDNLWSISDGDYMQLGRPAMPHWWEGPDMLAELVTQPILECLEAIGLIVKDQEVAKEDVPIILILPPKDRPFRPQDLETEIVHDIEHRLGWPLPQGSCIVSRGRTGVVEALQLAQKVLMTLKVPVCVIAGVETFLRQVIANYYTNLRRLKSLDNSNGFIPGEAASAVLIGAAKGSGDGELVITGMGLKYDPSGAGGTDKHAVTGNGLTEAMRQALAEAHLEFWELDQLLGDLNGEHFKFKELVFARGRLERLRPPKAPPRLFDYLDVRHPIEFIGEVGAAIFPLLLGWLLEAHRKDYVRGPHTLVFASEDNGERVAITTGYFMGKSL